MNKNNLIKLGAFCQREFNMEPDFKIMEVASDFTGVVRVAVIHSRYGYDKITLSTIGMPDNLEYIRCGYSRMANILAIQELEEPK
jgi:hypothetical protein